MCLIFYCLKSNTKTPGTFSDTLIITLIGSLTAIISIIGSFYLSNKNAEQQRALEIRKLKQEYYHEFTEALYLHATYNDMNSQEFKNAELKFLMEKNRLPLYASQDIVEWVDNVASGKLNNETFKTLYILMRKDLTNDKFDEFKNLKNLSVTLPSEATRKGTK